MQLSTDKSHHAEEIKVQFRTREGYYKLMNSPDYSQRSQRAVGFSTGTANSTSSTASHERTNIKISLVTVSNKDNSVLQPQLDKNKREDVNILGANVQQNDVTSQQRQSTKKLRDMKICFNVGRELFVYNYEGVRIGPDASNPIYKRFYKGSPPTCHDFNQSTATIDSTCLLVGFAHGQIQLVELHESDDQDSCKEYNADRLIDKTRVTCIKWLPNSASLFLVAHASGLLYLYKDDLPCGPAAPTYQLYKQSEGVIVYTCKTKTKRNPIYKWSIGAQTNDNDAQHTTSSAPGSTRFLDQDACSINEFAFSPCAKYLACVSQDGFLRVFCYDTMELVGRARSYYGAITCLCWSPDGKYVVTGGEDDLITVWSFVERRVVARGTGHKSWVSVVSFDTFYTGYDLKSSDADHSDDDDAMGVDLKTGNDDTYRNDVLGDDETDEDFGDEVQLDKLTQILENASIDNSSRNNDSLRNPINLNCKSINLPAVTTYRFGSVGQDTQLCLWDLSDDLLQQSVSKPRINSVTVADNSTFTSSAEQAINKEPMSIKPNAQSSNNAQLSAINDLLKTDKADSTSLQDAYISKTNTFTSSGLLPIKGSSFTKTFSLVGKRDRRFLGYKSADKSSSSKSNAGTISCDFNRLVDDPTKLLGSPICPRMNEVPLLEPIVCKKISYERLTSLIFCQGGFITSCQDGFVFSWARPSKKTSKATPCHSTEELLRVIDVGTNLAV